MGKNRKNSSAKIMLYVLLFGLIFVYGCNSNSSTPIKENTSNTAQNTEKPLFKTISSGSTDTGDASVDLTPRGMENGKFAVDFSINTHSVDLSQFDLMKITTLEYNGKIIKPLSAPKLSGHHSSGTLSFDTGAEIKSFKIIIRGIPAVDERVFEWS